jgi:hypothetical protein
MIKGINIPRMMAQAGQEVNNLQLIFGMKPPVSMAKSP